MCVCACRGVGLVLLLHKGRRKRWTVKRVKVMVVVSLLDIGIQTWWLCECVLPELL